MKKFEQELLEQSYRNYCARGKGGGLRCNDGFLPMDYFRTVEITERYGVRPVGPGSCEFWLKAIESKLGNEGFTLKKTSSNEPCSNGRVHECPSDDELEDGDERSVQ